MRVKRTIKTQSKMMSFGKRPNGSEFMSVPHEAEAVSSIDPETSAMENRIAGMKAKAARSSLPPQAISGEVLLEKYAKGSDSSIHDVRLRVARALAAMEAPDRRVHWEQQFLLAQERGFIPAGRINSAAGTPLTATLINCFVQPVGDSITEVIDGCPGIYTALAEAAETMRRGGGVGYDFSAIRPEGARVRGTDSRASGPVSYMKVFDRSCETVESAGSRRGAQMGVLRCDHPDIETFIHAKDQGGLSNFNISVAVTDAFIHAMERNESIELIHRAEPAQDIVDAGAYLREDGMWVYRKPPARELWADIMRSTYDHAEPGILFLDRINRDNNLNYCESIAATNPCGEQPLPPYGCCCLGSIDLTQFVDAPFHADSRFDFTAFAEVATIAVRMLDNTLDVTEWPLAAQHAEAGAKRRIGLGFTGLGDALAMLRLRYDEPPARKMAAEISACLRDTAYAASVALAKERGAFPLFNADLYLAGENFASRLPDAIRKSIRRQGIRNSHLLSIAPTGTISLAFADNASNGIEPPFSYTYTRKKRTADGLHKEYLVEDHAWRLYRHLGGDTRTLPEYFVTALDISADAHLQMVAAVAPYIDTSISKTVNVPENYPYADFESLYFNAWKSGLKGLATYRPNNVLGSVLSVAPPRHEPEMQPEIPTPHHNARLALDTLPAPVLASLRWPGRPELPDGNDAWTYMIESPQGRFALFVGHIAESGKAFPFEVWVNGTEQPRGLGAVAKTLSMDMRTNDRGWLALKLDALTRTVGDDAFEMRVPPSGELRRMPGVVSAIGQVIRYRCDRLHVFDDGGTTAVIDAMFSVDEPRTGSDGTLAWTVDVVNPAAGDEFVVGVKEITLPDGAVAGATTTRPYSLWLSGHYPRSLDGLARILSLDMRVMDPAWIGMKLRKLLNYAEPLGDFMAFVPGERRQQNWPSTVAYVARLLIHRYHMLGVLDREGYPLRDMGILEAPRPRESLAAMKGALCRECGNRSVIRKDGCDFCSACGWVGVCG